MQHSLPAKRLKKWLIRVAVVLASLLLLTGAVTLVLERKVKGILVSEINKQLIAEVSVRKVSLSLLRHFPQVSLKFSDVTVASFPGDTMPLLIADRLFLQFNLLDVLRREYAVRNIEIAEGKLSLKIRRDGKENYLILKEGTGETEAFEVALNKVLVRDVDILYSDVKNDILVGFTCVKTAFRGNFTADLYKLKSTGDIIIREVRSGSYSFFSGQESQIDLVMEVDERKDVYTLDKGILTVEGLPFSITGTVHYGSDHENLDLAIEGNGLELEQLMGLLPGAWNEAVKAYAPEGGISFSGTVRGGYAAGTLPDVHCFFGLDKATIAHEVSGKSLQKIHCKGEFLQGEKQSFLKVNEFSASLGNGTLAGTLELIGFSDPLIKMELNSDLDMGDLLSFFPMKGLTSASGRITMGIQLETALVTGKEKLVQQLLHTKTSGGIRLSNVSLKMDQVEGSLENVNGGVAIQNNDFVLNGLTGKFDRESFSFKGSITNLIPWLLLPDQRLIFAGTLRSSGINLASVTANSKGNNGSTVGGMVKLPESINGVLDFQIDKFSYHEITSSNVRGQIRIEPGRVLLNNLRMRAFNGSVEGDFAVANAGGGGILLDAEVASAKADIRLLFQQFRNFGQNDLVDKNLKGLLTSKIRVHCKLDAKGNLLYPSVDAIGDLLVEEGALVDYEPVKALARYTRLDDLSNINFHTLENQIRITQQKVIIPQMLIRSDAADFTVSGTHGFDGDIEYHLSLLLSDLMTKKARRGGIREEGGTVEQDDRGRLTLYLMLKGPVENPKVTYDKRGHREKAVEELKTEKETVKALFKKEFGTFIHPNTNTGNPAQKPKEGEILIEWDEDE